MDKQVFAFDGQVYLGRVSAMVHRLPDGRHVGIEWSEGIPPKAKHVEVFIGSVFAPEQIDVPIVIDRTLLTAMAIVPQRGVRIPSAEMQVLIDAGFAQSSEIGFEITDAGRAALAALSPLP